MNWQIRSLVKVELFCGKKHPVRFQQIKGHNLWSDSIALSRQR